MIPRRVNRGTIRRIATALKPKNKVALYDACVPIPCEFGHLAMVLSKEMDPAKIP
jgi:hypothetical protein